LMFEDFDGLRVELVGVAPRDEIRQPWVGGDIAPEHAIAGIHSVTLSEESYERTGGLLVETLGFQPAGEKGNLFRYQADRGLSGQIVQIECNPDTRVGQMGVGAVHHVAWRAKDDEVQQHFQRELTNLGYGVTPVVDRQYFKSIYFREPGQVLFEIATDPPGMLIDESYEDLGTQLKLPPWHEKYRFQLEQSLVPLQVPEPIRRLER
jgi:glyoxalase family protein